MTDACASSLTILIVTGMALSNAFRKLEKRLQKYMKIGMIRSSIVVLHSSRTNRKALTLLRFTTTKIIMSIR